jgi:formylmethanofuran dehydrogenase subunit C
MLQLSLKHSTTLPLEFSGITPDALREKSLHEIERLEMWHGREKLPLADLFAIQGSAADEQIEFTGDLASSVGIGTGMTRGMIRVLGNAGRHVGLGLWSGEIHVTGNAGDGLGTEMRGGIIRVVGSARDGVGGARIGSSRGMTGGAIIVLGNAEHRIGDRMRRGLIAIGGSTGNLVGHNMLAGTIVVGGACGLNAGAGLKRGTLCLLNHEPSQLSPTFRYACTVHSPLLGLVGRRLESLGFKNDVGNATRNWRQYNGDFLAEGRGEIYLTNREMSSE